MQKKKLAGAATAEENSVDAVAENWMAKGKQRTALKAVLAKMFSLSSRLASAKVCLLLPLAPIGSLKLPGSMGSKKSDKFDRQKVHPITFKVILNRPPLYECFLCALYQMDMQNKCSRLRKDSNIRCDYQFLALVRE